MQYDLSFLFSDERGLLYPYTPDPSNPGDTRMLREEELAKMGGKNMKGVPAVLLQDILPSISSNNVILKLDVQGYECKVREGFNIGNHFKVLNSIQTVSADSNIFQTLQPSILLGGGGKFISAIFIEWAMIARWL